MKAVVKTHKPERQEKRANFINWCFTLLRDYILLVLGFLLGRAAWLQIIAPGMLVRQGDMRPLRVQKVFTSRGTITDRSGRPLAMGVPVKAIWADPKKVHGAGSVSVGGRWRALSTALNPPPNQLASRINANLKGHFTYLVCRVNLDMVDYIRKLRLPGIHLREESHRYYPSGEVTTHLIGLTNVDNQGTRGVERSLGKWLTGQLGKCIIRKDRYGRVIEDISPTDSQAAHNLALDTDERLQALVYRELNNAMAFNRAESGNAVLVDVNTGEVLTTANSPSYNPDSLTDTSRNAMRNCTITGVFGPGPTVRPMVVMTALQRGAVRENAVLNTIPYRINGHEIKDVARYNELTLTGVLQKSSNAGVSKLALAMPSSALVDTYSHFGLGKATNLGSVGERSGLYSQEQRWFDIERATFSFGYGLTVTLLQLTRVYATTGSYGVYRPLPITKVDPPVPGGRIFPEDTMRAIVHMMENMALPGGGGAKAATRGYRIAIKTGIAKRVGPDSRYIDKYIACTAGIAPANQPRFASVVATNDPQVGKYYDGTVPASVFSAIMGGVLRTMNVEPGVLTTGDKNELMNN